MKVLIIGASGMLGHKLVQVLQNKFDVWATLRTDKRFLKDAPILAENRIYENISADRIQSVKNVVETLKPDVVINAVGIIKQLPSSNNTVQTLLINSIFPHLLSEICGENRAKLIQISTDCVFSGKKGNYSEEDIPDAYDLYGKSKNLGEVVAPHCLTLRTSIIGRELNSSHSLLEWFLSNQDGKVKGFTKAIFSGFPTVILSEIISNIIENQPDLHGLYHVSSDPISKFDLLVLLQKAYGVNVEIAPDDKFEIDRSLDSRKFREETGFMPPDWNKMIEIMANDNELYQSLKQRAVK